MVVTELNRYSCRSRQAGVDLLRISVLVICFGLILEAFVQHRLGMLGVRQCFISDRLDSE
jgi:hypothetical protein